MPLAPDAPYEIGDQAFGGYVAGLIDTTQADWTPDKTPALWAVAA